MKCHIIIFVINQYFIFVVTVKMIRYRFHLFMNKVIPLLLKKKGYDNIKLDIQIMYIVVNMYILAKVQLLSSFRFLTIN